MAEIGDEKFEEEKFDEVINPSSEPELSVLEAEEELKETEMLPAVPKKQGRLSLKLKIIANYAARGYPVEIIAKKVKMSPNRVYRIIENNSVVWEEINRILKSLFVEGDIILSNLFVKALRTLETRMNDPGTQEDAIRKIVDLYGKRTSIGKAPVEGVEKPTIIQQFYGQGGQSGAVQKGEPLIDGGIDELIIRKRKERGLDIPKVAKKVPPPADDDLGEY